MGDVSQSWQLRATEDVKAQLGEVELFVGNWFYCEGAQSTEVVPSVRDAVEESQKLRCLSILHSVTCQQSLCKHSCGLFSGTCLMALFLLSLLLWKGDEKQENN